MRNKSLFILSILTLLSFTGLKAQVTITSTGYLGYYYAAASASSIYPGGGITFNVVNTNSSPIALTSVGYSAYLNYNAELWYSSTSLTGGTGIINASNTAWTLAASVTNPTVTFATIANNFFTGFSVLIPANTTYRFAVKQDGALFGGPTLIPGTFSSNGVTLDANSYWGADQFGGLVYTGYGYYGSITFTDCFPPTGLSATNILSKTADVSWNAVTGSTGYDYLVDMNPTYTGGTYTTVTGTTYNITGLTPNTTYYLHVRNRCSSTSQSGWANFMFKTLPPCSIPANMKTPNLQPNSTGLSWDPVVVALTYDYVVDQTTADPVSATNIQNTPTPTGSWVGLTEDTKYYVHIRSNCTGEQSNWSLDSFVTPIPCRAPQISIDNINIDEAVAYWKAIPTAVSYEYAITTTSTPPVNGTDYQFTSIHASALNDGKEYFMHVRSFCISQGIESFSPWATASFKTFALGVNNTAADGFSIDAFPNPAHNKLNIRLNGKSIGDAVLHMTDLSGKIIRNISNLHKQQEVDLGGIAPGIYMLRYKDDTHNQVIKITKQ
jgi:hypothetical protein